MPLPVDASFIGAFNSYSLEPHTFNSAAVHVAQELAAYAAIVLHNAGLYFSAAARADQMAQAMKSRAVIEEAKGVLMAARRCDADEAFNILVRLSQQSHRKLRDIAQALVDRAATITD